MTPVEAIAKLDRQIAEHGQDVELRRVVPNAPALVKPCRAFVRGYRPQELTGGILQGDTLVVLSPSSIPGEFKAQMLRANDRVIWDGRPRNVRYCDPVRIKDEVVRYNVVVQG